MFNKALLKKKKKKDAYYASLAPPPCPLGTLEGHVETVVTNSQQQGQLLGLNFPICYMLRKDGAGKKEHIVILLPVSLS